MNLRRPKSIRIVAIFALLIILALLAVTIVQLSRKNEELSAQLEKLRTSDKQSFIVRQISKQMEEIAQGQKDISDKRRIEAEAQTLIAEDMRMRADEEKRNALIAEGQAIEASKVAKQEQREANEQRKIAEASRNQAVAEKNRADTLAYIALGRSLGSKSTFQYNAGNYELARILAYYSWLFTTRYGGNVFDGVIYSALLNASGTKQSIEVSKSAVTSLSGINNTIYITTKYGEVKQYNGSINSNNCKTVFSNKNYDFRDCCIDDKGNVWALTVDGQLLHDGDRLPSVRLSSGEKFFKIMNLGSDKLCAVSSTSLFIVPISSPTKFEKVASGHFTAAEPIGKNVRIATSAGELWSINANGKIAKSKLPQNVGLICTMAWSNNGRGALGNTKGEIFILDNHGTNYLDIKAHKSSVSRVGFVNDYLFSSGYDGYLYMWNIQGNKYESTTLTAESSWIQNMYISSGNQVVLLCLASGKISQVYINPNSLAKSIKTHLKKGLTQQDWNYYIGSQIPYEKI